MSSIAKKQIGFTIVELLIVIVVIAILAAISIVAYSGIQQRANNTQTIAAAEQSIKLLQLYKATNGSYPSSYWLVCFGEYDGDACRYTNFGTTVEAIENTSFKSAITSVGTMPQPSTKMYTLMNERVGGGVIYFGGVNPQQVLYYLGGLNQNCSVGGVASNQNVATLCTYTLP